VTDQSNLSRWVKFYREALARGVKPIVGVDLLVREGANGSRVEDRAVVSVTDSYRNVTRLVSRAYLEGQQRGVPMIDRSWLSPRELEGLPRALTARVEGEVGGARERTRAGGGGGHRSVARAVSGPAFTSSCSGSGPA